MIHLIEAALAGGIIVFLWQSISWMVLPWHRATLNGFKDEDAISRVLVSQSAEKGIYLVPGPVHQGKKAGPFAYIAWSPAGATGMGTAMVRGFIVQVLSAALLVWILQRTGGIYNTRVEVCMAFALGAGLLGRFPEWNWWHFPARAVLVEILDLLIAWTLAGCVMIKLM